MKPSFTKDISEFNFTFTEELIKKAQEMGIDLEDLLIRAIAKNDPDVKVKMEIARRSLNEAEEYLKKGDPLQASEKAYKSAEKVIKALAENVSPPRIPRGRKRR